MENHLRVHLDVAQRIVNILADGESHVSQEAALQLLEPLLAGHVGPAILEQSEMPEKWFTVEITPKDDLVNELSAYLHKIKFTETEFFFKDLEEKYEKFKTKIHDKI
jgi:hypothetical protein